MPANRVAFRYNQGFRQKLKALQKLPKAAERAMVGDGLRTAAQVVINFKDGIRKNNFHLITLKPGTVKAKQRMQMSKPKVPLYGLGDEHRDSYINALGIRVHHGARKTTFIVGPSYRRHHGPVKISRRGRRRVKKGGTPISLSKLVRIHETGAFVRRGKSIIVLPPRPAVRLAWERTLKGIRLKEKGQEMRRALAEAIQHSRNARLEAMSRFRS